MEVKKFTYEFLDMGANSVLAAEVKNDNQPVEAPSEVNLPPVFDNVLQPIYTEEELQLAKSVAREEGMKAGGELAKSQFLDAEALKTQSLTQLVESIEQKITLSINDTHMKLAGIGPELKKLALAIAKKVTGMEANANSVETYINEHLSKLSSKGDLKIIVNPAVAELLTGKFKNAEMATDETIPATDFRIEWDGGFAERKLEEIWKEIGNILQ